jgi:hypothetical protein
MNRTIALVVVKAALGASLVIGFAAAPHGAAAHAAPVGVDVYAYEVGDDNADGVMQEDESGWDCTTMGNRICGVGNAQGAVPGDWSTTDAEGNLVPPHGDGPYAFPDPGEYDDGAYVGGYN